MRFQTAHLVIFTLISLFLFTSCSNQMYKPGTTARKSTTRPQPRFIKDVAITPGAASRIGTEIPSSTHSQGHGQVGGANNAYFNRYEKKKKYSSPATKTAGKTTTIVVKPGSPNYNSGQATVASHREGPADESTLELCTKYANILGITAAASLIHNLPLYNFIEEWYGVPYQYGGNDKSGIDCSAFVQRMYENVFCMNMVRTAFEQFRECDLVESTENLREGDLVFFYTVSRSRKSKKVKRRISHVGVYLANDYFVHASSSSGVMISSLKDSYWSRKFAGAGQIPGI